MDEDVPDARGIAEARGISMRYMNAAEIMRQTSIAARLLAAAAERYTLGGNDPRDIGHIAAAVATGARFFVTGEPKLCRWIEEFRDITGALACVDWRTGECRGNAGRDKADTPQARGEDRENNP